MTTPFFSIITPVHNRVDNGKLKRCLNSVMTQTFEDFEHIIVDDGSEEDVEGLVAQYDNRFHYIRIPRSGRVIARNTGMEAAKGRNIAWVDSDDVYDPLYLKTFAVNMEMQPEAKLWICAATFHGMIKDGRNVHICPKWSKYFKAWIPPVDPDGPGHKFFTSGKITSGQFVFARECLDKTGLMPPWKTLYEVADGVHEWTSFTDEIYYSAAKKWCGNPWGEDFVMFLALCKHYRVHAIEAALLIHYLR